MQETPPSTPEYQQFKENIIKLDETVAQKVEQAIKKSQINEAEALKKVAEEDPHYIDLWFDTFFEDLKEALKGNIVGISKLQDAEERIQHVIDNKILALTNKYFGTDKNLEKAKLDKSDKEKVKQKRQIYSNAREALALMSALGVSPGSLKDVEELCSKEQDPTSQDIEEIAKFEATTGVIASTRILMIQLDKLRMTEYQSINQLVKGKIYILQRGIKEFLENPHHVNELSGLITEMNESVSELDTELRNVMQEQIKTQQESQQQTPQQQNLQQNKTIENVMFALDIIANICIPYYTTARLVYSSYKEGKSIDTDELFTTIVIDTAFLLPVAGMLGKTLKVGGKLVGKTIGKGAMFGKVMVEGTEALAKSGQKGSKVFDLISKIGKETIKTGEKIAVGSEKISKAGQKIEKVAESYEKLYKGGWIIGTGMVVGLSIKDLGLSPQEMNQDTILAILNIMDKGSKATKEDKQRFLTICETIGYLVISGLQIKKLFVKKAPSSQKVKMLILRFIDEIIESDTELRVKRA